MYRRLFYLFIFLLILAPVPTFGAKGIGALISPGKLTESHAKYDKIKSCTECHVLTGGVQDKKCLDCHDKLDKRIKEKKSPHAKYTDKCIVCHREHKGRNYQMIRLDEEEFDHDDTGYELKFEHKQVECAKCHKKSKNKKNKYNGLKQECAECHDNVHNKQFKGQGCEECHTEKDWEEETFKHDSPEYDGYKLEGKHTEVECAECHVKGRFKPIKSKTCDSALCHRDEHKKQFKGQKCKDCHVVDGWEEETFKHESPSYKGYKLEGKHRDVKCAECHVKGKYRPIKTKTCDGVLCHNSNEHKDQFKGQSCDECHTVQGWDEDAFDHDSEDYDGYKLEGKHRDVKCAECHIKGVYKPIKETCITCHKDDDDHKDELGKVCETCHTVNDWKEIELDHDRDTDFPLTGKHNNVECNECHTEKKGDRKIYKNDLFECEDCHDDYHDGEYEEKCKSCHTQYDWEPRDYKHYEKTGYRLEGAHNDTECTNCHISGGSKFKNVKRVCGECHLTPHLNQFGGDCSECHSVINWSPSKFDHALTGFILTGNHRLAECKECHDNRSYRSTSVECIDCHRADYIGVNDPDHVALNYPEDCRVCHLADFTSWDFNHANTGSDCASCHLGSRPGSHVTNNYKTTCSLCHSFENNWTFTHPDLNSGSKCVSCHLEYSNIPMSSMHKTNGWLDCEACHSSTTIWLPPGYDHSGVTNGCSTCHTNFSAYPDKALRTAAHSSDGKFGGHGDSRCELCHTTDGAWAFKHAPDVNNCSRCHLDYSTPVKSESHTANNWTICEECHDPAGVGGSWLPASYKHTGVTDNCASCHLDYSTPPRSAAVIDHTAFTTLESICEECHSGFTDWTGGSYEHSGATGICHTCHVGYSTPQRSTPHSSSKFGGAGDSDCELCHTTTAWLPAEHVSSITDCAMCHLSETVPSRTTSHSSPLFGGIGDTTCEECHTVSSGWSFEHNPVLTGCANCHLNNSTPEKPESHTDYNWRVCEECHNPAGVGGSWLPASYKHNGVTDNCGSCHLEYSTPPRSASAIDHSAFTTLESICEECHSGFVDWTGGSYEHSGGAGICHTCHLGYSTPIRTTPHIGVQFAGAGDSDCELCHTTGGEWSFVHVPDTTGCAACHLDYSAPVKPESHTTNNWTVCEECHVGNVTWAGGSYKHTGITSGCAECHLDYSTPLRSASAIDHSAFTTMESICEECHSGFTDWSGGDYEHSDGAGICHTCHLGYSTPARTTPHTGVQFAGAGDSDCELCHTTEGEWSFVHVPDTTGCAACHLDYSAPVKPESHTTNNWTVCEECHVGNVTWVGGSYQHTGITNNCAECHLEYSTPPRSASAIDHTAFTTMESICEECHSGFTDWSGGDYEHSDGAGICHTCHLGYSTPVRSTPHTGVQFAGAGDSDCELCHTTEGEWSFVHVPDTTGCAACHLDYSAPVKPESHTTNNWTVCEECHSGNVTWAGGSYKHTGITSGCAECHLDYSTPPRSASAIDHTAFTTLESICEECHSGFTDWTGGSYEHSDGTGICHTCHIGYSTPLRTTAHISEKFGGAGNNNCELCHTTTAWLPVGHVSSMTDCAMCHLNETIPQRTTPHSGIQFAGAGDSDCELCHTIEGGWSFVHVPDTTGCAACHLDYSAPVKPESHTTNNWTVCEECHSGTVAWTAGSYQHTGITNNCAECHLEYSTPPRSASLIDHSAFTTLESICEECHSGFTAWTGGSYEHSDGIGICHTCHLGYSTPPRTTAHTGVQFAGAGDSDCELCHTTEGEWAFVHVPDTTGCAACHLDYSAPVKPESHTANNWTVCEECHVGNVTWAGGSYKHTGITNNCAECHLDYSTPPRSASLIDHSAFTTLESICEECHSGFTAWTGGDYEHSDGSGICHTCHLGYSTPVRSTAHTGVQFAGAGDSDCELCHTIEGGWAFVHVPDTTGCAACHLDYSAPVKPESHTANNWTVCEECHVGNVAWTTGSYQHTGITNNCAECHLEYSTPPRSASLIDHTAFTTLESICEECHSGFTDWTGGSYEHSGGSGICHTCHLGYSAPIRTTAHISEKFGGAGNNNCELCHTTTAWLPAEHVSSMTDCAMCHLNETIPQRTTPHSGIQFAGAGDSDCELCHTIEGGWAFVHVPDTTGCAACHLDYSTPVKPESHTANNWTVCEECHSGNVTWTAGSYQHTGITNNCAECHLEYSSPPRSASLIDHTAFTTLESICEECHSGFTAWTGGSYEHSGGAGICHTCHLGYSTPARTTPHTGVQFAGAGDSDCELCHTTGGEWSFVHVPDTTGCAACHLDYSAPVKPESHTTNNWTVCEECHVGNVTWAGGSYKHTGITSGCAECHLDYSTPPRSASAIDHSAFTTMESICEECHSGFTDWTGGSYEHSDGIGICHTCHIGYSTPLRTTAHISEKFGGAGNNNCELCHTTTAWLPVGHVSSMTDCAMCHLNETIPQRTTPHSRHSVCRCRR